MIDFSKLDKTIHEKGRLAIMTLLATRTHWSFQDLKDSLEMSDRDRTLIAHTLYFTGKYTECGGRGSALQSLYGCSRRNRAGTWPDHALGWREDF